MEFRIDFRPFKLEDAKFINSLRRNEEMENMVGGHKRPVAYEGDLKWIEDIILKDNPSIMYFAVTPIGSDEIVGYTSIPEIDYRNGSCFWSGIKLDSTKAERGWGTEVALKMLKFIFEELRVERCRGECLEQHSAVLKMLLKVGFVNEGLMRKSLFKNGKHNNQYLLGVIREDYLKIKEQFNL